MNILIINGSPRKKGLISQMLGIMQAEAEKRGDTVEMVYTNDLTVKPCTGCMACRTKGKCVLAEDDSQRVLKMMQQATNTMSATLSQIAPASVSAWSFLANQPSAISLNPQST